MGFNSGFKGLRGLKNYLLENCVIFTLPKYFYVYVTVHRVKFLIIKPTRCTNFSNLFLEWNSTCYGQLLCPSSGVFHCTHSNGKCQLSANLYDIHHCCVYSGKLL